MVDSTAEKIRAAESEAVGWALGHGEVAAPRGPCEQWPPVLQSADFEAALLQPGTKTESAAAGHSGEQSQ